MKCQHHVCGWPLARKNHMPDLNWPTLEGTQGLSQVLTLILIQAKNRVPSRLLSLTSDPGLDNVGEFPLLTDSLRLV